MNSLEYGRGQPHSSAWTFFTNQVEIKFLIRAFDTPTLLTLEEELRQITTEVLKQYDKSSYEFVVTEQYRNMKDVLDKKPEIINYALEAITRSGVKPDLDGIRGGTDGSRFSFMGRPTANIFAGEHGIHSKQEWVSVQDMQKAVMTIVNLVAIWEEKA